MSQKEKKGVFKRNCNRKESKRKKNEDRGRLRKEVGVGTCFQSILNLPLSQLSYYIFNRSVSVDLTLHIQPCNHSSIIQSTSQSVTQFIVTQEAILIDYK